MKIRANISLDIDLTPDDIIAGMQDQDFEEFRVKLNKVAEEYHSKNTEKILSYVDGTDINEAKRISESDIIN